MPLNSKLGRAWLLRSLLTAAVFSFSVPVFAADCVACGAVLAKYNASTQEEQNSNNLLAANRAMLATLSPNDISKKVKISSNILILTAKSEKAANEKAIIQQEFNAKGCQTCPR